MNPTIGTILAVLALILAIVLAAIGQLDPKIAGLIVLVAAARIFP